MAADQQFCLRWNNHQSTLISVFDQLLENGTLVDCTLAAEGQLMKAHKVVLSACSPYFELMLSEHYEKHPIIVLKDVKYQELKAIMDYMYRGEVNILQEQLGSLLKVAESLQIKGLSESGGNEKEPPERKKPPATPQRPQHTTSHSHENKRVPVNQSTPLPVASPPAVPRPARDECPSPVARKKEEISPNSSEDGSTSALLDGLETSSSSELPPQRQSVPKVSGIPAAITSVPNKPPTPMQPVIEEKIEPLSRPPSQVSLPDTSRGKPPPPAMPIENEITPKLEPTAEVMIQPKAEYVEEEEDIEDLTLDDDDELNMSDHAIAGPSHGGEGSSQGFQQWQIGDQSQDEVFMAAQEAVGAQRDSQDTLIDNFSHGPQDVFTPAEVFPCPDCNKKYKYKSNLSRHRRLECGKEPQFQCPYCYRRMTQKSSLIEHIAHLHPFVCNETITDFSLVLNQLQSALGSICTQVKSLHKKVDQIMKSKPVEDNVTENTHNTLETNFSQFLPIKSKEALITLEQQLEETQFSYKLIEILVSLGGKDYKSLTINILKRLLEDNVAVMFSYTGKKAWRDIEKKEPFAKRKICKVIHDVVRKVYPKEATDDKLKHTISAWLNQAKVRILRRGSRQNRLADVPSDNDDDTDEDSEEKD